MGMDCGSKAADHRVRTTEPQNENLEDEDANNEEYLSSPRDYNVRHHYHRLFPGKVHLKK
jgi:hypothetical protein